MYVQTKAPRLLTGDSGLANTTEVSWASLYRIGAVLLPLAGLFALLSQIVIVYLDYQPYPQPASVPDGFTTGWVRYIDLVGSHASAYNAEFVLLGLAALALLPGAIALLVSLRKVDIGFSIIGTAFLVVGVVFAVIESVDFFTVTQAASAWDSGCTACGIYPLQESFGASTS